MSAEESMAALDALLAATPITTRSGGGSRRRAHHRSTNNSAAAAASAAATVAASSSRAPPSTEVSLRERQERDELSTPEIVPARNANPVVEAAAAPAAADDGAPPAEQLEDAAAAAALIAAEDAVERQTAPTEPPLTPPPPADAPPSEAASSETQSETATNDTVESIDKREQRAATVAATAGATVSEVTIKSEPVDADRPALGRCDLVLVAGQPLSELKLRCDRARLLGFYKQYSINHLHTAEASNPIHLRAANVVAEIKRLTAAIARLAKAKPAASAEQPPNPREAAARRILLSLKCIDEIHDRMFFTFKQPNGLIVTVPNFPINEQAQLTVEPVSGDEDKAESSPFQVDKSAVKGLAHAEWLQNILCFLDPPLALDFGGAVQLESGVQLAEVCCRLARSKLIGEHPTAAPPLLNSSELDSLANYLLVTRIRCIQTLSQCVDHLGRCADDADSAGNSRALLNVLRRANGQDAARPLFYRDQRGRARTASVGGGAPLKANQLEAQCTACFDAYASARRAIDQRSSDLSQARRRERHLLSTLQATASDELDAARPQPPQPPPADAEPSIVFVRKRKYQPAAASRSLRGSSAGGERERCKRRRDLKLATCSHGLPLRPVGVKRQQGCEPIVGSSSSDDEEFVPVVETYPKKRLEVASVSPKLSSPFHHLSDSTDHEGLQ